MTAYVPQIEETLARPPRGQRPRLRPLQLLRWCRTVDLGTLRAALWALRACRRVHSAQEALGLRAPRLPRRAHRPRTETSYFAAVLSTSAQACATAEFGSVLPGMVAQPPALT